MRQVRRYGYLLAHQRRVELTLQLAELSLDCIRGLWIIFVEHDKGPLLRIAWLLARGEAHFLLHVDDEVLVCLQRGIGIPPANQDPGSR